MSFIIREHKAYRTLRHATGAEPDPAAAIFQPDDAGRVATHVTVPLTCPFCRCDLQGERIQLFQPRAGRVLVFHTVDGHVLTYKGQVLQRIDCGKPVTCSVLQAAALAP